MMLRAKLVSQRTCLAHATVVADDEPSHFFFSHVKETTTVDIFLIG